jgi:ATP-dependent HslUV protease subunit HslV
MTTLAYRDQILAADSGAWVGNVMHRTSAKLAKDSLGRLHGVVGNAGEATTYLNWVRSGMEGPPPMPKEIDPKDSTSSFIALIIELDGTIYMHTAGGQEEHIDAPYFALGSGSEFAMGAMYAGGSAETAVHAAAAHSNYAATPIVTMRLGL